MTALAATAQHLRHVVAVSVQTAEAQLIERLWITPAHLWRRVAGCSEAVRHMATRYHEAGESMAQQRLTAAAGRPRQGEPTRGSLGTSSTESIATELARLSDTWHQAQEAVDLGLPTAIAHVLGVAGDALGALCPEQAWDDLIDAVEGLEHATTAARQAIDRALRARAWQARSEDVDPPPMDDLARCSGWPKVGRCENYRGLHGHRHPSTGTEHHGDLCDDCYRALCPLCWQRARAPRDGKPSSRCEACHKRAQRAA